MTRTALVLNAGASWAAYQVGALRHVVRERGTRFELTAGTGIGGMNAAFVACGEFDALDRWWGTIGLRALVRPSLRPWRGPATGAPQRAFIAAHVSEAKLERSGTRLLVGVMDLCRGDMFELEYPGADVPLVDALMAAVATPGLIAPITHGGRQLAEGTFVESLLVSEVRQRHPGDVLVIAGRGSVPGTPPRYYRTWHAVGTRAAALNLDHDVDAGLADAQRTTAVVSARAALRDDLRRLVADRVADPATSQRLFDVLKQTYGTDEHSELTAITPTRAPDFPLWAFPKTKMRALAQLGESDARRVLAS